MPRRNGSYFGFTAAPTPSSASGIWRVSEAEQYLRVNKWPATPGVPGSPTGTPGDGQVSLTWSAPTLGSPPTDYEVQYSSNSGSTWTTFTDGLSMATSATVTGLTNGTGYIFRVRALNALGEGPYGSASGTVTPTAIPVAALLHFNGTNGSTTFTDSSPNAFTVTKNGDAVISTAESKFGGASGLFSGSGNVTLPYDAAFDFGTADFTIEMWAYFNSTGAGQVVARGDNASGPPTMNWAVYTTNSGTVNYYLSTGYGWDIAAGSLFGNVSTGQWYHIALVRSGSTFTGYLDGVAGSSAISEDPLGSNTYHGPIIGSDSNIEGGFSGYVDEFRIVNGTAMYTADFTPPASPF